MAERVYLVRDGYGELRTVSVLGPRAAVGPRVFRGCVCFCGRPLAHVRWVDGRAEIVDSCETCGYVDPTINLLSLGL